MNLAGMSKGQPGVLLIYFKNSIHWLLENMFEFTRSYSLIAYHLFCQLHGERSTVYCNIGAGTIRPCFSALTERDLRDGVNAFLVTRVSFLGGHVCLYSRTCRDRQEEREWYHMQQGSLTITEPETLQLHVSVLTTRLSGRPVNTVS